MTQSPTRPFQLSALARADGFSFGCKDCRTRYDSGNALVVGQYLDEPEQIYVVNRPTTLQCCDNAKTNPELFATIEEAIARRDELDQAIVDGQPLPFNITAYLRFSDDRLITTTH